MTKWTGGPGRLQDQGRGVVLYDQGEGYQPLITSRIEVGVAKYLKEAMMFPSSDVSPV